MPPAAAGGGRRPALIGVCQPAKIGHSGLWQRTRDGLFAGFDAESRRTGRRLCADSRRRQPPRGRGTRMCRRWGIRRGRFIPARAGNAAEVVSPAPVRPVHPRAGGERRRAMSARSRRCGSSPRGRGTLGGCNSYGEIFRFIPARAGNATIYKACGAKVSVHPRAGGERAASSWCRTCRSGSSPRGRGTPRVPRVTHTEGYSLFNLTRALSVVNCQSAFV